MKQILLRAGKDPFDAAGVEETLAFNILGDNCGNALFSTALHRILSSSTANLVSDCWLTQRPGALSDRDIGDIDERFDIFVLPMANAFRRGFSRNLQAITRVIERLTIPVVVVGVGAQLPLGADGAHPADQPSEPITRFVRAVLDRSASIGVRGDTTRSYLASLGFGDEHVDVVGCPSLSARTGPPVTKRVQTIDADSALTINLSPEAPEVGSLVERHVDRYPRLVFIPQQNRTLALMLWGEPDAAAAIDPRLPYRVDHPLYEQGRMRFFVDPRTWIDYLATRDFTFGTRIHGNVAALMAGTPAVEIEFDSRTRELSEYHEIPRRTATAELMTGVDAAQLYADADFSAFNAGRVSRRDTFVAFLRRNGLEAAPEGGADDLGYAARLAEVPLALPVRPLTTQTASGSADLIRRLQWLRQGADGDRTRRGQLPEPALINSQRRPRSLPEIAAMSEESTSANKRLAAETKALNRRIEGLTDQVRSQRHALDEQLELVAGLQATLTSQQQQLAQTLQRSNRHRRRTARAGRFLRSPITTVRRRLSN